MMKLTRIGGLASVFLVSSLAFGHPPAKDDPNRPVMDVLERVKKRGEEQKVADRELALRLLQQAQAAKKDGMIGEAVKLAERANAMFPESPAMRQALQDLRAEQRDAREQGVSNNVAKNRLEEAVDLAERLLRERQFAEARAWAEVIKEMAGKFPQA